MKVYDLKTLHLKKAFGIDKTPYFSWKIESEKQNVLQSAYQLIVCEKEVVMWDSGKVYGRKQSFVEYQGPNLSSATNYWWRVTVWNNQDEIASAEGEFETALLNKEEWIAKWVESTIPRLSLIHI